VLHMEVGLLAAYAVLVFVVVTKRLKKKVA